MNRQDFLRTSVALAAAVICSTAAHATSFEVGDGWTGSWNSSLSVGSSWRMRDPDSKLLSPSDAALVGLDPTGYTGANAVDEGNANYGKGARYTTLFKLFSELEIKKGDLGFLVRGKAWYDQALSEEKVRLGNQPNGYNGYDITTNTLGERRPLSDKGFERLSKFKGLYLLDAYVYDTFEVADLPMQVRAGNQVVNWGESLFIQGLNQINPIDVPSFRKPGAQLKEVFLPVPILDLSQSLGSYGSIEAFWQAQWKSTPIEGSCGNYWSVAVGTLSTSPGACNNAIGLVRSQGNAAGVAANAYVPTLDHEKPKNSGEFGLAYRFSSDALDTEFGFYGMQLHSRTPIVSIVKRTPGANPSPISVFWEYPEDIKRFGISASTNVMGWSVSGEVSRANDVPVQVDGNDLLNAGLAAGGAVTGAPVAFGPYGSAAMAAFAGNGYLPGYTRTSTNQIQLNTIKAGNGILAADQYLFIGEVGMQTNNLPKYKDDPNALRYGRGFIFGAGSNPNYATPLGAPAGTSTCALTLNRNVAGCENDGYMSRQAWGYRLKGELTYNGLIPGVTVYPGLYFSHDVKGYSVDSQFVEGRQARAVSLRFSYAKAYTLELGAVGYNHKAKYDNLRDRDNYYVNGSVSF